jgi:outer membrane protein OmpA-like peptidoglycan-associated protein/Tol biopolymer transport system component
MIKYIMALLFLLQCNDTIFGQKNVTENLTENEKNMLAEGKKAAQKGDLKKSNKHFEALIKSRPDFIEVRLRLATNYYQQKSYENSEAMFQGAIEISPDYDNEMYFSLASVQAEMKKYLLAAGNFDQYSLREKVKSEKVKKAIKLRDNLRFKVFALQHPVPFEPMDAGPAINSKFSEYSPSLALDGSSMIFTRNVGQEDFYIAALDSNSQFKNASPLFNLNTNQNEGAHAISADGRFMVFTACDRRDVFGSCDLYYSMLMEDRWTIPANMGHRVNSAAWDSQPTLSADGRTLIFSSRRLGTKGGADLWITWRDEKDAWVTPVNLGPEVNSTGDDESPFLHPDGQTLYFRSDGHAGMGSFDIFYSRKNEYTDTWQKPENIGYPINTEGEEGAFVVSLDGKTAYFVSDTDFSTGKSKGNLDIYYFHLYEGARPRPSSFIKGFVTDAVSGLPLKVKVTMKDLTSGKNNFVLNTDKDGYFISGISVGKNYACIIQHKDYQYYAENINLTLVDILHQPYLLKIALLPVTKMKEVTESEPVVLQNIFFRSGSAELLAESGAEIDLLYSLLIENPELNIKITGYTDNVGKEEENKLLSEQRAAAVAHALLVKGIDSKRINSEGKGELFPIDTNDTEAGRQKNRRTAFVIMKKG